MKIEALLIGCGNIGALYDLEDNSKTWSHAKAYSKNGDIELTITDPDIELVSKVAARYGFKDAVNGESDDKKFQIVSITSPTPTHFFYLRQLLLEEIPVIICEKPLVSSLSEIDELEKAYKDSSSKVLVNYIRRFQPAYSLTKERLRNFKRSNFRGIILKYKRGFLNNASHAVDLIEYLFDEPLNFDFFSIQSAKFDCFLYDPTIFATCSYLEHPFSFIGLSDVSYPVFEIEIFYDQGKVVLCHSGDEVRYYSNKAKKGLVENMEERQTGILDHYMIPVIDKAVALLTEPKSEDNFMSSLRINKAMLEIIESIKSN